MAEKPRGGDMPHRIEAKERVAGLSGGGGANEDIHELRMYIMQMMHSEMELMESVKQNEDSIATVNGRIEKLKELIMSEKHRSKQGGLLLTRSSHELKALSDKKMVVEAKYRQYREAIDGREVECRELKAKHQHLRRVIKSLEISANTSDQTIDNVVSTAQEVRESHSTVLATMDDENELNCHRAELQKTRAKKRYIDQHAEQIAVEAKGISEQQNKLKQGLAAASGELCDIDVALEGLNVDTVRQKTRLLQEIQQIRARKEQSGRKLTAKQKKYRVKMKGEISTLKKRVTFVARELEGHEMGMEDILSSLAPFQDSRNVLESRLSDLEAEIAQHHVSIRAMRERIDDFDTGKEAFDLSPMKSKLQAKNVEVDLAVRNLTALKSELAKIEEETSRTLEEKLRLEGEMECFSLADVEEELARLREELKQLEDRRSNLTADKESMEEMYTRASSQAQKTRQQLKRAITATKKQQKELCKASRQEQQASAKLVKAQEELARVEEAEQLSIRLKASLDETKTSNEARLEALEKALRDKEQEWKRQCLDEEARFKADLEAWNEKVQALQAQLA